MSLFKSIKNAATSLSSKTIHASDNMIMNKDIKGLSNHALIQFHVNLSENLSSFPLVNRTQEEKSRQTSYTHKQNEASDEIIRRFNLSKDDITRFSYEKLHGEPDGADGIRHALSYFPHKHRASTGLELRNSKHLNVFLQKLAWRIEVPKTKEERHFKQQEEESLREQKAEARKLEEQARYAAYEASPEWAQRQANRKAKGLPSMKSSLDPKP